MPGRTRRPRSRWGSPSGAEGASRPAAWLASAVALALVAGCGDGGGSPTPAAPPAEVLVVVTATPGTPEVRPPTPAAGRRYVVREGDTLSAIAARFGVEEAALQRANGIDDPNSLFAGQELVIPAPEP